MQSPAFDARPENDLFTIRNIGNQLATAEGSIEYGVGTSRPPMLVILGHSGCGAVKAAMGDFSQQPPAIRHEIETIIFLRWVPRETPKKAAKRGIREIGGRRKTEERRHAIVDRRRRAQRQSPGRDARSICLPTA